MVKNYLILLNVYFFKVLKPALNWIWEACFGFIFFSFFLAFALWVFTFLQVWIDHIFGLDCMDQLPSTWDDIYFVIFNFLSGDFILLFQVCFDGLIYIFPTLLIGELFFIIYDFGNDFSSKVFNFTWNFVFFIFLLILMSVLWEMLDSSMCDIFETEDWWWSFWK